MNARIAILAVLGGSLALLLTRVLKSQSPKSRPALTPDASPVVSAATPDASPVVSIVEETLHQHEGEQSPFVAAFEEALHSDVAHGAKPA